MNFVLRGECVRVISGSARGLKLSAPEGLSTRPTTDRVKESIFNIIGRYLPVESVLDLFAGSGALGIEALSRACSHAVFVENDNAAIDVVKRNTASARVEGRCDILKREAMAYLCETDKKFDIIFLDPPYNTGLLTSAAEEIRNRGLLTESGIIVAETELGGEEPSGDKFEILKKAKYGKTLIFVLKPKQP